MRTGEGPTRSCIPAKGLREQTQRDRRGSAWAWCEMASALGGTRRQGPAVEGMEIEREAVFCHLGHLDWPAVDGVETVRFHPAHVVCIRPALRGGPSPVNPMTPGKWSRLLVAYGRFLADQDSSRFASTVSDWYLMSTLESLAVRGPCEARRAAILALGLLADYRSSAVVGERMRDADQGVRWLAERASLELWLRDGTREQRAGLSRLWRANEASRWEEAIGVANDLLQAAPRFAEVWHARATAYAQQGDVGGAMRDWQRVLELNPYHFPAAIGLADCHVRRHESLLAQTWWQRALFINPGLEGVRRQLQGWYQTGHLPLD